MPTATYKYHIITDDGICERSINSTFSLGIRRPLLVLGPDGCLAAAPKTPSLSRSILPSSSADGFCQVNLLLFNKLLAAAQTSCAAASAAVAVPFLSLSSAIWECLLQKSCKLEGFPDVAIHGSEAVLVSRFHRR